MYADTIKQMAETLTALELLRLAIKVEHVDNVNLIDLVDINADIRQLSQTLIRIGGANVTEQLGWLPDNAKNISLSI